LQNAAQSNWLLSDSSRRYQYLKNEGTRMSLRVNFEPIKAFRIDVTFTRTQSLNLSEDFTILHPESNPQFDVPQYNPVLSSEAGTYSISFLTFKTMFDKIDEDGRSPTFELFEDYRRDISVELAEANSNSSGKYELPADVVDTTGRTIPAGFQDGYGPYSQDVLIPAFIAAYSGLSPSSSLINTRKFIAIPKPNWRVSYNGLAKLEFVKKFAKSVNLTHGYTSTLSISNYNSNLEYLEDAQEQQNAREPNTNNFVSFYDIPQISISEALSPLLGIDITWQNNLTTKLDIKRNRSLRMSFLDYQLSETRTNNFTIGIGYRVKGFVIPFPIQGKKRTLENDLNFKLDFSFIDNKTVIFKLDQDISEPTRGNKTITISPSIDYVISQQLNLRIFYERRQNIPATSSAFPITNTSMGITVRFTLAQ